MKTAEQIIQEWIDKNDSSVTLYLSATSLPDNLPESLRYLSANSATSLPDNLPASLRTLSANSATSLPDNLPASLRYLSANSATNK